MDELMTQALSLGVSGLLFVMWWFERQERAKNSAQVQDALSYAGQLAGIHDNLLDVVRANTDAVAALREELRAHRMVEEDWWARVARQFEGRSRES